MLRLAKFEDMQQLAQIEKQCFKHPWSQKMLEESFENGCVFVVCEQNDKIVGYGGLYSTGDITNVAVLKEFRHQGIGKDIVEEIKNIAKSNNIDSIFLEVRVSNQNAIKLYEKCGFKLISTRKKYYEDGEDALIYAFGGVVY